ncbi:PREDICTED: TM2 domain-containing protein almondex [Nicrophorus vespilloides]|uniref:TM2 domain-containing protein almondex n=1 Tax=Nicrophorus vespilloides TaxID=110193 RepID=A0ABM1N3N3_NICVS|nr:PREDICTED: TM2 domain-containing protein almondex [Nicrophorus vespilloides]
MKCVHINIRKATLIVLSILLNGAQHSHSADNHMDLTTKNMNVKNTSHSEQKPTILEHLSQDSVYTCPQDRDCDTLSPRCMNCNLNYSCIYGEELVTKCSIFKHIKCRGDDIFEKKMICRYCFQTEPWEHSCDLKANCNSIATTRSPYTTNCTVHDNIICLGPRTFNKNVLCNWTGGYRWSTALILSITLGGFGADRFYLGHWQEGIGKLFSFGGLGVWTLIDVILISLQYLGPADGSLYI